MGMAQYVAPVGSPYNDAAESFQVLIKRAVNILPLVMCLIVVGFGHDPRWLIFANNRQLDQYLLCHLKILTMERNHQAINQITRSESASLKHFSQFLPQHPQHLQSHGPVFRRVLRLRAMLHGVLPLRLALANLRRRIGGPGEAGRRAVEAEDCYPGRSLGGKWLFFFRCLRWFYLKWFYVKRFFYRLFLFKMFFKWQFGILKVPSATVLMKGVLACT